MFCSNCGARMPDDSAFCPECGASVTGESNGNPQQTVKQIPEVGTKKAKMIIIISGMVAFGSMFLGAIRWNGGRTASIYERMTMTGSKEEVWIACAFILLIVVFNALNCQEWSLIGCVGLFAIMSSMLTELWKWKKMTYASLYIGFWLFGAAAIVCIAVSAKEATLSFLKNTGNCIEVKNI